MSDSSPYVPFSQRSGLSPLPQQLRLGEISTEFRTLIVYALKQEIERNTNYGYHDAYLTDDWKRIATDYQVRFLKMDPDAVHIDPDRFYKALSRMIKTVEYGPVFDSVEFLSRHPLCSVAFKSALASAFEDARLAYRLLNAGNVIAVGNEIQAEAVLTSIQLAEEKFANGARQHLLSAGSALKNGEWAGSVRESIHAVEATAKMFAPSGKTLGEALNVLEQKHEIHSALKKAFGQLYGYTNDEKGVRHSLVLKDYPDVGEAEALFMLGACASFVSYLLTKMSEKE